ncbi:MAG: hypothetical protein KAV42_07640 [Candidatus Krumholzibacteria bacterium]|nr:hypothetical protein [Candidatus Krumholzibacteria bacterium]
MKIDSSPAYLVLISAILILSGCAVLPSGKVLPSGEDAGIRYPALPLEDVFIITCKVRIDLPKYRVRGSCRIVRYPDGSLQVDFLHSSLFGSYREDATIYIDGESIVIQDHERGKLYDNETTLSLLEEHFGFRIHTDDIAYLLLLAGPPVDGGMAGGGVSGEENADTGDWRGRNLSVTCGENGLPTSLRQCMIAANVCYNTRYGYGKYPGYPEKIVIENESGPERVALEVTEVKEEALATD